MSKQSGLIKIKGKLGGVSFYRQGNKDLAKMANGPDKERIARDPAYARTRENNQEFGGAATAAKAFRLSLGSLVKRLAGDFLVQRTMKLFKQINRLGTGERGRRTIRLAANPSIVNGLELNIIPVFSSVFQTPFEVVPTIGRSGVTINVNSFVARDAISAPASATHFKMIACIGLVSDYIFDDGIGKYKPENEVWNGMSVIVESAVTALEGSSSTTLSLTAAIDGAPVLPPEVTSIVGLGIEFYQQSGGLDYRLAQGNCMRIVSVLTA